MSAVYNKMTYLYFIIGFQLEGKERNRLADLAYRIRSLDQIRSAEEAVIRAPMPFPALEPSDNEKSDGKGISQSAKKSRKDYYCVIS